MKNLALSLILLFSIPLASQAKGTPTEIEQQKIKRVEIADKEIPAEARKDIIDKYHGAVILKAYKEMSDGEHIGYLVEIKKGPKTWDVRYDINGNPINKVKPQ